MTRTRTSPSSFAPSFFREWTDDNERPRPPAREPSRRRRRLAALVPLLLAGAITTTLFLPGSPASADPSANTWYRLRMCESGNNYAINTGNNHYGAYQFDLATWHGVGGSGYPNLASPAEQDRRALILYRMRGWQPWQCAGILGLREDSDARSGRTSDLRVPSSRSSGFPGRGYFVYGETGSLIAQFQKELGRRGAPLVGTGQFGPKTSAALKRLQAINHIPVTGTLGPVTYALAWHGRFWPYVARRSVVPAFPRGAIYRFGQDNSVIARFQKQLGTRGAPLVGTGQFGPKTFAAVRRLQALNGFVANGRLGPRTFRAAWVGSYRR